VSDLGIGSERAIQRSFCSGWPRRPAEAVNNLIKRVKRAAFGFTSFRNYRVRSLLYVGKPNRELLPTVTPR
jgi:transposase